MQLNSTHIVLGILIALAVTGGVALTVWQSASAGDIQVVEIASTAPAAAPAQENAPAPAETRVGVYLSGAVVNPGVYTVDGGSRLANVLLLAGGATAEADLTAVNLAAVVHDEDHWHIPARGEVESPSAGLAAGLAQSVKNDESAAVQDGLREGDKIDLNSADAALLKTLPGIGDVKAQAIVSYREANGYFASVDGLLDVNGIGINTVENIRDLVTVE